MKTRLTLFSILFVAALGPVAGCIRAPVVPPTALVYTDFQAPLDVSVQDTPTGGRKGRASVVSILGLVSYGDASIEAAAQEGGIRLIEHADYEYFNVLGIYQRYTTVVRGE